ncbi:beta-hexosaminidase subunit alpha-like [Antedon mediterranea]|uniref:beta-hexosaminidase subunit alpha-like n=1 Tax=Antedon mediterranea TaxID=105859 RepID=UPI003AF4A76B
MFCLYGLLICCVVVIDASKVYYIIPELPLKYTEAAPGSPWPQPQEVDSFGEVLAIRESRFQFDTSSIGQCEVVDMAVQRYKQVIFDQTESADEPPDVLLNSVSLELEGDLGCEEYPTLDSDESYAIEIKADGDSKIKAEQVWGLLRGLETFSQLIYQYNDEGEVSFERGKHAQKCFF